MKNVFLFSVQVSLCLNFFLISEVAMSSNDDQEHEQLSPDVIENIKIQHIASIKTAIIELTNTNENKRRLAGIRLRHLSLRSEGISYSVSKTEVSTIVKQIESEKHLAARVAEVSALSEVYHHSLENSDKSAIADILKRLSANENDIEITLEAQYQIHLIAKTNEPKDYSVFEKIGLKKSEFVAADTHFGHAVFDFTRLKADALIEKSEVVTKALANILSLKTDSIILLEALDISNQIGNHASTLFSEIANLTGHEFWRIRKISLEILFRAKKLELIKVERKTKLNSDPIPEVLEKVRSFGLK